MVRAAQDIFIIAAPSGAGKTTLVKALMKRIPGFAFSISATTRPPRVGEQEGVDYYFIEEAAFKTRIAKGDFLEYEEVYPGRFYGTLRSEVDRILAAGQYPLFDVDVVGALNIKRQYGDRSLAIFIQPPQPEILLTRLQIRGKDSPEEIQKRYAKSREELAYAPKFDYILINDDLDTAIDELYSLVSHSLGLPQS